MSILKPFEVYRTFRLYVVEESSFTTGNSPRALYRHHTVSVGGVEFRTHSWEPVVYGAYTGGWGPVYGETVEAVKARIDHLTRGMRDDGSWPEDDEPDGRPCDGEWASDRDQW